MSYSMLDLKFPPKCLLQQKIQIDLVNWTDSFVGNHVYIYIKHIINIFLCLSILNQKPADWFLEISLKGHLTYLK